MGYGDHGTCHKTWVQGPIAVWVILGKCTRLGVLGWRIRIVVMSESFHESQMRHCLEEL